MTPEPLLQDLDAADFETLPCCGVKDPAHEGRVAKNRWVKQNFANGLRAKVLLTPDHRQCGYMEYLPGEYAWRGVKAGGYLFIHCVWTFYKVYKGRGFARAMVEACQADARAAGVKGVAVVARDRPWLAGRALFRKCGFEVVDTAPPDYQLLAWKLDSHAASPEFQGGWEKKLREFGPGLTMIRCDQCPHIARFADQIALTAREEYGLEPRVVQLESHQQAQQAPTPYAVFAIIRDGRLLTDHQVSLTRFRNIMKKLPTKGR